jgi:hypothetical protein
MKPVYIDVDNLIPMNIYYFTLLYEGAWEWWICQFAYRKNNALYFRWRDINPPLYSSNNNINTISLNINFVVSTYISSSIPKSWFFDNVTRFYRINSVNNFKIPIDTLTKDTIII